MPFAEIYKATKPLDSLKRGGTVALSVVGGVPIVKKGYEDPILLIQTISSLGFGTSGLLVTLVGYGSKVLDINDLKKSPLIMMGLTSEAAGLLIVELKILYDIN